MLIATARIGANARALAPDTAMTANASEAAVAVVVPIPANDREPPPRPPRAAAGPRAVGASSTGPGIVPVTAETESPAGVPDGAAARPRVRVEAIDPLERYLGRGEVTRAQYDAARRLARDFHRARLAPRVTTRYVPRAETTTRGAIAWRTQDMAGEVGAARDRVRAALRLLGPAGADVVWCVCGEGHACRDWALRTGRHKGDGMILLRAALDALVDHYDPGRRQPAGILAWIDADDPATFGKARDAA